MGNVCQLGCSQDLNFGGLLMLQGDCTGVDPDNTPQACAGGYSHHVSLIHHKLSLFFVSSLVYVWCSNLSKNQFGGYLDIFLGGKPPHSPP